ncbi:MAG: hypothetical protein V4635_03620 [Bacteroidota bacterium]
MNKFKIIIGCLLLYSIAKEYISASKQLFTFFDPTFIILCLVFLVLCAWLIGSGISKQKLKLRSWSFLKYYGICLTGFLLLAVFSLATFKFDPVIVRVNGIDVDIAEFVNGTKTLFPDEKQRVEYCTCVVTKLTADKTLAEKYKREFESGKFAKVITEVQSGDDAYKFNLNECMSNLNEIRWTAEFEKGMRAGLMKEIKLLGLSETQDTVKYCDCLIEEYKKMSIKDLSNPGFQGSYKSLKIDSVCHSKSKLN